MITLDEQIEWVETLRRPNGYMNLAAMVDATLATLRSVKQAEPVAKDAARYRWMAQGGCPFAETDDAWDSKESLDAAIDAAMGADQRGKE